MRNDHGSSTWAFSTLKDANEMSETNEVDESQTQQYENVNLELSRFLFCISVENFGSIYLVISATHYENLSTFQLNWRTKVPN